MEDELPFDINKIVDDYVKKELKERKIGVYYPSELSFCVRRNYYSFMQPKAYEADTLRIFEAGNIMHEFINKVLKNAGFEFHAAERSLSVVDTQTDLVISGRLDNLVVLKKGEEPIIIEVKSIKSLAYTDKPKDEHVMQLTPYLRALNAKRGMLIYVEKNTLKTKAFYVHFNKDLFRKLLERARSLHNYLSTKAFPPAEAKKNKEMSWMCDYCIYKDECNDAEIRDEQKRTFKEDSRREERLNDVGAFL